MIDDLFAPIHKKVNVLTLKKAKKRLEKIKPLLDALIQNFYKYQNLSNKFVTSARGETSIDEIMDQRYQVDVLEEELLKMRDELAGMDCILKDWRTGLIDFIGNRNGKKVWLCYQMGEGKLKYYHDWERGFNGRKQIDFN